MLTGSPPFTGRNPRAIMARRLVESPPLARGHSARPAARASKRRSTVRSHGSRRNGSRPRPSSRWRCVAARKSRSRWWPRRRAPRLMAALRRGRRDRRAARGRRRRDGHPCRAPDAGRAARRRRSADAGRPSVPQPGRLVRRVLRRRADRGADQPPGGPGRAARHQRHQRGAVPRQYPLAQGDRRRARRGLRAGGQRAAHPGAVGRPTGSGCGRGSSPWRTTASSGTSRTRWT